MNGLLADARSRARTVLTRLSRPGNLAFLAPVFLACLLAAALPVMGYRRAELVSPAPTPLIEDRAGGFLTEGESEYQRLGFWNVDGPLNERVVLCLTAIEDRRFFRHSGVDARSLARSLWNNLRGGDRQGASTIAMQVARLQSPAPRNLANKAIEMSTAFFLVAKFGHEEVMRHYLKIVPQGNQIFGVAYAARRYFRKPLEDVSLDDWYFAINTVRPSFIRVEADEVTYNLHIMVRFQIERQLISGKLAVRDVPACWNDTFRQVLGITPPDDARGCLQDIHWSIGAIGYFPTYALGNLYAAQFFEAARQAMPDLDDRLARGELLPLREWLRENIHRHGRQYRAHELVQRVTGRPLSHVPFIEYLKRKYGPLYGF